MNRIRNQDEALILLGQRGAARSLAEVDATANVNAEHTSTEAVFDSDSNLYYAQQSAPKAQEAGENAAEKAVDELFKDMRALEKEQVNKGAKKAAAKGKGSCYGTLMQMDLQKDMFLVGDIFMRKFYSVFDRDHDRVGLAEAVH